MCTRDGQATGRPMDGCRKGPDNTTIHVGSKKISDRPMNILIVPLFKTK